MAEYTVVIDTPDRELALKHLLAQEGAGMDAATFVSWIVTRRLDDAAQQIRVQVQQLASISDEQFEAMTKQRAEAKEAKRLKDEQDAQRNADEAKRLRDQAAALEGKPNG